MKKVVILSLAVMMIFVVTVTAHAAENNWRFVIRADNNANAYISDAHIGMYPTSVDGFDGQDAVATYLADPSGNQFAAWCSAIIPGRTEQMYKDIKAPFATNDTAPTKSWDLRVYALKDAAYTDIRLRFLSASTSTTLLMPASFNGVDVVYYLRMTNNHGVVGAPANGTEWIVPRMSVANTTNPFFTLIMPTGYQSGGPDIIINPVSHDNAAAEGYAMQFGIRPVPEPSSVLALGSGLTGLLGFIIRRRRG